MLTICFHCMH